MKNNGVLAALCLHFIMFLPACTTIGSHQPAVSDSSTRNSARVARAGNGQVSFGQGDVSVIQWNVAVTARLPTQQANESAYRSLAQGPVPGRKKTGFAMGLGARDVAPAGLNDFCFRLSKFCFSENRVPEPRLRPHQAPSEFMLTSSGLEPSNHFPNSFGTTETSQTAIRPIVWSDQTRQLVASVNRQINRAMVGTTDRLAFGRDEYWAMPLSQPDRPLERARPLADCEDFALEKRQALISAGVPETALYLAVAATERIGLHAVLIISTVEGDFVLDNLTDWLLPWTDTQYMWIKRQSTTSMLDWVVAGGRVPTDQAKRTGFTGY